VLKFNPKNPQEMLKKKKKKRAGCWWLLSVILATQEAEIRRMEVQSQQEANSSQDQKRLAEWLKW
jgi:hypothetical protein